MKYLTNYVNVIGCSGPDTCIPFENDGCFVHCPVHCGPEETLCPSVVDEMGCPRFPDYCVPIGTDCQQP